VGEGRGAEGAEGCGVWGEGVPLPTGGGAWGEGAQPLPTPFPFGASILATQAPAALDLGACGASSFPTCAVLN